MWSSWLCCALVTLVKCYGPKFYRFSALVIMTAVVVVLDRNLALAAVVVVLYVFWPKMDQNHAQLLLS